VGDGEEAWGLYIGNLRRFREEKSSRRPGGRFGRGEATDLEGHREELK
jgi:hypothetical protein